MSERIVQAEIDSIIMDTSIQCRASIDTRTVDEYAQRMTEGDEFPPVVLYGTSEQSWIADGWHRILAAKQITYRTIPAFIHAGGRADALRSALSANVANGLRRTTADKRRCIEIALAEFPSLSNRALAQLCGVDDHTVAACRTLVSTSDTCGDSAADNTRTVVGKDGKTYTVKKPVPETPVDTFFGQEGDNTPSLEIGPCTDTEAMYAARRAIANLQQINDDDPMRGDAFDLVRNWLTDHDTFE